jgi:hypothetical protein
MQEAVKRKEMLSLGLENVLKKIKEQGIEKTALQIKHEKLKDSLQGKRKN